MRMSATFARFSASLTFVSASVLMLAFSAWTDGDLALLRLDVGLRRLVLARELGQRLGLGRVVRMRDDQLGA